MKIWVDGEKPLLVHFIKWFSLGYLFGCYALFIIRRTTFGSSSLLTDINTRPTFHGYMKPSIKELCKGQEWEGGAMSDPVKMQLRWAFHGNALETVQPPLFEVVQS